MKKYELLLLNTLIVSAITFISILAAYGWPIQPQTWFAAGTSGGLTFLIGLRTMLMEGKPIAPQPHGRGTR